MRPKLTPAEEAEKEKKRIARKKERRATLILGLIMGSFIACWFPFFFLYSISPVCPICELSPDSACCVRGWGFTFAFWLGYSNSALNPVIYTIFNKDFRRAFKRILFKWIWRRRNKALYSRNQMLLVEKTSPFLCTFDVFYFLNAILMLYCNYKCTWRVFFIFGSAALAARVGTTRARLVGLLKVQVFKSWATKSTKKFCLLDQWV